MATENICKNIKMMISQSSDMKVTLEVDNSMIKLLTTFLDIGLVQYFYLLTWFVISRDDGLYVVIAAVPTENTLLYLKHKIPFNNV